MDAMAGGKVFEGLVNKPGIQYPYMPDLGGKPYPLEITAEFLRRLDEKGFQGVPFTVMHGQGEFDVAGRVASHKMDGENLVALFDTSKSPRGSDVAGKLHTGIVLDQPVQLSFETDHMTFEVAPAEAMKQGVPLRPVDGVVTAVSAVPRGACGDACAVTKMLAEQARAGNESPTKAAFRLTVEALMAHECEGGCQSAKELQARFEAVQKEATDAKAQAEAAVKAQKDAEAKLAEASKPADPDASPTVPSMSPEDKARLDKMEETIESQGKVIAGYQAAEREAVVEVVSDLAPEGFEVDAEAPMEVLMAQKAAFEATKPPAAPAAAGTGRRHGNPSTPELDASQTKVLFRDAMRLGEKSKLPAALRRNRPDLLTGDA